MALRLFSKTVAVTFVDEGSGTPIVSSDVPLDQLPETFAIDTTVAIRDAQYVIVRAAPVTKAEFAKTKRLNLYVRRVEYADPRNILFSLPSICGAALPEVGTNRAAGTVVLHEDNWRQCEFVANIHRDDVAAELAAIRNIHATAAANHGWREMHVRERIVQPLPRGIAWGDILELIGSGESVAGVAFEGGNEARGAVAVRLAGDVLLWGIEADGELTVLCVENLQWAAPETVAALKRIADALSLMLVDWCRCRVYASTAGDTPEGSEGMWEGERL